MAATSIPAGAGRSVVLFNIADNGQTSDAITIPAGARLVAIQFPSQIDASALTFTASVFGTTYAPVTDPKGTALSCTIAASKYVQMPDLSGINFLKLVLGTAQTTGSAGVDLALVFESISPAGYWHANAVLAAS